MRTTRTAGSGGSRPSGDANTMGKGAGDRIACIDVPDLALQCLLRRRPDWRERPVAVIEEDRPQAPILMVNEHARALRILPGMRLGSARGLCKSLRAEVVSPVEIDSLVGELFARLASFSPRVEPASESPGTFWVDPGGLERMYGGLEAWSLALWREIEHHGLRCAVIVGFGRERTRAIAATHRGCWVIPNRTDEQRLVAAVPLTCLKLPAAIRDELLLLGIYTLGELLSIAISEIRLRFPAQLAELHAALTDGQRAPLRPRKLGEGIATQIDLDDATESHAHLLHLITQPLPSLLNRLVAEHRALLSLHIHLELDRRGQECESLQEVIEPAQATLDLKVITELLSLRLERMTLPAPVLSIRIEVHGVLVEARQLELLVAQRSRDPEAAMRALARVRATFGTASVSRARLVSAHLPEASFRYEASVSVETSSQPLGHGLRAHSGDAPLGTGALTPSHSAPQWGGPLEVLGPSLPLMRRLLPRPIPLPPPPRMLRRAGGRGPGRSQDDLDAFWPHVDARHGRLDRLCGPLRISGAWWAREVERDYYYAMMSEGPILWIFFDRPRQRWYLHGELD